MPVNRPHHPVHGHFKRRVAPFVRNLYSHKLKHLVEVFTPRDGDRSRAHRVFEHKIPPDDPRHQFAHRGVRIRVRAARHRNHRRKFRVAEACKRTPDAGHQERERDRGASALRNSRGRAHKDSGADHATDSECDELPRAERALELMLPAFTLRKNSR